VRPALRAAAAGREAPLVVHDDRGGARVVNPARWSGGLLAGDPELLDRCDGATLDVGCGPGRLAAALAHRGQAALGVDICPDAVELARRRGATALRRDVFAPLPGEGRWRHVLLADGNIGIGGNPDRLLRRCRDLIAEDGEIMVETEPPGADSWTGRLRMSTVDNVVSAPFAWAYVSAGDLAAIARGAALRALTTWTEAGRWFTRLAR
jgi:SAM-dependent methyltransferase